ncbi:hypothetical protein BLNAU_2405 [Blattamonas nauphoetae]|uniref:Armadillo-like helical domain-containing protein n=1 Tax=Blattamonas nauphoetae TaxID=2049346 RepID=A0ABQ9YFU4_9EUKA|nr:hypothetical protein BLNAU_2405 [Blattamonas nauphoetae]
MTPEALQIILPFTVCENSELCRQAWWLLANLAVDAQFAVEVFFESKIDTYLRIFWERADQNKELTSCPSNRLCYSYPDVKALVSSIKAFCYLTFYSKNTDIFWSAWPLLFPFIRSYHDQLIILLVNGLSRTIDLSKTFPSLLNTTSIPFMITHSGAFEELNFFQISLHLLKEITLQYHTSTQAIFIAGLLRQRRRIIQRRNGYRTVEIITSDEYEFYQNAYHQAEGSISKLSSIVKCLTTSLRKQDITTDMFSTIVSDLVPIIGKLIFTLFASFDEHYENYRDKEKAIRANALAADHLLLQFRFIYLQEDDMEDVTRDEITRDNFALQTNPNKTDPFTCSYREKKPFERLVLVLFWCLSNIAAESNEFGEFVMLNTFHTTQHPGCTLSNIIHLSISTCTSHTRHEFIHLVRNLSCSTNKVRRLCVEGKVLEPLFLEGWQEFFASNMSIAVYFFDILFELISFNVGLVQYCSSRGTSADNFVAKQIVFEDRLSDLIDLKSRMPVVDQVSGDFVIAYVDQWISDNDLDRSLLCDMYLDTSLERPFQFPPAALGYDTMEISLSKETMDELNMDDSSESPEQITSSAFD